MGLTYKDSGVDIEAGNRFVKRIADTVAGTFSNRVITGIGGFGALYDAAFPEYREPVLVASTDGVGTKLAIARMMNKYDTVGIDAVAMCVNDIIVSGARPLFFLDYIACGRLYEDRLVDVIAGLAEGCRLAECSLIGGETAEHPGTMAPDELDIAGFAVGVVDKAKIIDGSRISVGDTIIGLSSSGIHSNGYSLVRRLLFDMKKLNIDTVIPELAAPLGEVLLTPTRIYVKAVTACLAAGIEIRGIVHITGGGFYENVPRILPPTTAARINRSSIDTQPIFHLIQKEGRIADREMFTTFNMGIGMMIVVPKQLTDTALDIFRAQGERPFVIGDVTLRTDEAVVIS